MSLKKIRVGGVPEHFNLPWQMAIESESFAQRGVDLQWQTYPGGTGQMTQALRSNEVDLCVLLSEGIIKDIILGNPSLMISLYVTTPLTWGIHTGIDNPLQYHDDIYDKRYAISRYGSGSHLMAMVDAHEFGTAIKEDQFVEVRDLEGALSSLAQGSTDVFYWEKFTTKPYVDQGMIRRIGEFITPWPCFVIAATKDILDREPQAVIRVLRTIHDECDRFMNSSESAIARISNQYGLSTKDATRWYHRTEWAIHGWVRDSMVDNIIEHLQVANIIDPEAPIPEMIWKR